MAPPALARGNVTVSVTLNGMEYVSFGDYDFNYEEQVEILRLRPNLAFSNFKDLNLIVEANYIDPNSTMLTCRL